MSAKGRKGAKERVNKEKMQKMRESQDKTRETEMEKEAEKAKV